MKKTPYDAVEERMEDFSTPEEFCFGMKCEQCGDTLYTRPVRFVKAGVSPESEGQKVIFEAMYQRDKQLEYDRAVKTLAAAFNRCPVCKRYVCNRCFVMTDDVDLCICCAERLGVTGQIVGEPQPETPAGPLGRTNPTAQTRPLGWKPPNRFLSLLL